MSSRKFCYLGVAILLAVALVPTAQAQLPRGLKSIDLYNLQLEVISNGKPHHAPSDDGEVSLQLIDEGLTGAAVGDICTDLFSSSKRRIVFRYNGGSAADSGNCKVDREHFTWSQDYRWTSSSTVSGGKIVLSGEGISTKITLRGCAQCAPEYVEIIQQATVTISGDICVVASYHQKRTTKVKKSDGESIYVQTAKAVSGSYCKLVY